MTLPTKEQARTLEAIRALSVDGIAPTYRELQAHLGLKAVSGVHKRLSGLKERGLVDFVPGRQQTMQIVARAEAINLAQLSKEQLTTLLIRVQTELVGRWKQ